MKMSYAEPLLRKMGADVQILDSGCCDMAGPFELEREKYAIAQAIGKRALQPAVRQAPPDTLILSDAAAHRLIVDKSLQNKRSDAGSNVGLES